MSKIRIYNTLTRKKEPFSPRKKERVDLFVCGPTVYDLSHIGHARTYIAFDTIVRYLRWKGHRVFYLQNITDIDDKIIRRAEKTGTTPLALARRFEKKYLSDMEALGIDSVDEYARATEHIKEIISQVQRLEKKGYTYLLEDGVYFDLSKFEEYGKLSGRTTLEDEDSVSRIDEAENKKNKGDFCLWKFSKPNEPRWESPWGQGRPGWHIEDTAITEKYFGSQYDIHGGARDLIFPHHEAEIAQMESISGKKPLVRYWIHTGFLTVDGEKMSKSLGNFITISEFLKQHSPRSLRLLVLSSHYRSPIDYTEESISQAEKNLERIKEFVTRIKEIKDKGKSETSFVSEARDEFEQAMSDDFNTPEALASLFNLIKKGNRLMDKDKLKSEQAEKALTLLKDMNQVLDLIPFGEKTEIPGKVVSLVRKREGLRKKKEFEKADEIRKKIEEMGYRVEDSDSGPKIKPAS